MTHRKTRKGQPRRDYDVGYGRPPEATQFKPGQSGNPKGRPKGAKSAARMARDALDRLMTVVEDGAKRKITARQLAFRNLAEKAAAGDPKALAFLLAHEEDARALEPGSTRAATPNQNDAEIISAFLARQRQGEGRG